MAKWLQLFHDNSNQNGGAKGKVEQERRKIMTLKVTLFKWLNQEEREIRVAIMAKK